MNRVFSALAPLLLSAMLCACTTHANTSSDISNRTNNIIEAATARMAQRRVNDNWSVFCSVDHVTGSRRCVASTFGRSMALDGAPFGGDDIPFQIYFFNGYGPFIAVGAHTFPGRQPVVRIDTAAPVIIHDDAGVSPPKPNPGVIQQMLSGNVLRARFYLWPEGAQDMYVDISGFAVAWHRLVQQLKTP